MTLGCASSSSVVDNRVLVSRTLIRPRLDDGVELVSDLPLLAQNLMQKANKPIPRPILQDRRNPSRACWVV